MRAVQHGGLVVVARVAVQIWQWVQRQQRLRLRTYRQRTGEGLPGSGIDDRERLPLRIQ